MKRSGVLSFVVLLTIGDMGWFEISRSSAKAIAGACVRLYIAQGATYTTLSIYKYTRVMRNEHPSPGRTKSPVRLLHVLLPKPLF